MQEECQLEVWVEWAALEEWVEWEAWVVWVVWVEWVVWVDSQVWQLEVVHLEWEDSIWIQI